MLNAELIRTLLHSEAAGLAISCIDSCLSTNSLLREAGLQAAPEGRVLIAKSQSVGRGRRGRSFFSPGGSGLYLSLLLRPAGGFERATGITTMAAAAMCAAIEELSGSTAGIKWVNDIFIDGKKVCGILTEAVPHTDGSLAFVVLGAGVNVFQPPGGFPEELAGIAGSVLPAEEESARERLAAAFLNRFMTYYRADEHSAHFEDYRRRSLALGRRVRVIGPSGEREGTALGLDDACRLLVQWDDGTREYLSSGEISIRFDK